MIANVSRVIRRVLPWFGALLLVGCAGMGGFSDSAPKGIDLGGDWRVDAGASDDLRTVLEAQRAREGRRPARRAEPGQDPQSGQQDPSPDGREARRQRQGAGQSAEDARAGREDSPIGRSPFQLPALLFVPDRLRITQTPGGLAVQSEDGTDEFEAGGESVVSFGRSGAERHCGWHAREFVVETRAQNGPTQSRSYALGPAGTLVVTTRLSGQRVPKLAFRRVYRRWSGPDPGAPPSREPAT